MGEIRRFSRSQIAIHAIAAFSILVLYITGLPITFPDQVGWIPALLGGYPVTMFIHRIAAAGFIITGVYLVVYHGLYDVFIGGSFFTDVWPGIKDIKDAVNDTKHILRLSSDKPPRYGKYDLGSKSRILELFLGSFHIPCNWKHIVVLMAVAGIHAAPVSSYGAISPCRICSYKHMRCCIPFLYGAF